MSPIGDLAEVWGDQHLAQGGDIKMIIANRGGRRCDRHLRIMVVGDAAAPSAQNSAAMLLVRGKFDAQAANRWLHAEMNCVRASCLLQFTHPHTCCHTVAMLLASRSLQLICFSALSGFQGRSQVSSIVQRSGNFPSILHGVHHNYAYRHFDESVHLRHFQ